MNDIEKINKYKLFWKRLLWSPITYITILIVALSLYYLGTHWGFKVIIEKCFGHFLTIMITTCVMCIFFKK